MIQEKFVDRFARNSGLKDKFIAEREVILTYALHALKSSNVMAHLAFKGGTALRKLTFGSSGRFSMDLDFTLSSSEEEHDNVLQSVLEVFDREHHGIVFRADEFYMTDSDTSFGGDIKYTHYWNNAGTFKLQISLREQPTLAVEEAPMLPQEYFKELEFKPFTVRSLVKIEMIAEKIRAGFQRSKVRDLYDLSCFAMSPLDTELLRGLVVLKLWQSKDPFDPDIFFRRMKGGKFDWDDLRRLVRSSEKLEPKYIIDSIEQRYAFLRNVTDLENQVIADSKGGRNMPLAQKLRDSLREQYFAIRSQ